MNYSDFVNNYLSTKKSNIESKFAKEISDFEGSKIILLFIINEIENGLNFGKKDEKDDMIKFIFDKSLLKVLNLPDNNQLNGYLYHAIKDFESLGFVIKEGHTSSIRESYIRTLKIKYPLI